MSRPDEDGRGPEDGGTPRDGGTPGDDRIPEGGRSAEQDAAAWDDIVARLRPEMPAAPPQQRPPWPVLRPEPLDDEHLPGDFVPPEPPPVLSGRPSLVAATAALLVPLLALLVLAVLPVSLPGWALLALVAVAVAGGVALFLQLPRRGDGRGDRLDRGAEV